MRSTLIFALLLALSPAAFAKSVKKPDAEVDKRKPLKDHEAPIVLTTAAPNFCLFGGKSGKPAHGEASFKSLVWRSDVVYVGETHDEPLDHMAQFEALKAMKIAKGSKIAVGFEMLQQAQQPILDDYAAGKLTEAEFLEKIDWKKTWGFDYAMYKPLFDFIVQHRLRALALNVPRKLVGKVARGGLAGLAPEERALLPEKLEVTAHKKYNEYMKKTFEAHMSTASAQSISLDNYLASMAAWNEGMGAKVAEFVNANPGWSVLVVAGNGHLLYNAAIPASVKSRTDGLRQVSFLTETSAKCPEKLDKEHKDMANYVWYMNHAPKPKPEPAAMPALSTATLSVPVSTASAAAK